MTRPALGDPPVVDPPAFRRAALLTGAASALTLVGVILAVVGPAWLTGPLQALVGGAGAAAPVVYVLLCALAAPLHLGGVLVALSPLTFSLPLAIMLSFLGLLLGNGMTFALLARLGGAAPRRRSAWPGLLQRLALQVDRRPLVAGLVARLALGCGAALEGFFLASGYARRTYLMALLIGAALYAIQTVLGVTLLHALLKAAPGLAGVFALSPLLLVGLAALGQRRRKPRATRP